MAVQTYDKARYRQVKKRLVETLLTLLFLNRDI